MAAISVIIPVYNVYNYLDRCVQSVLDQSFKDFEIILIAGDSKDGSTEKCISWEKSDKRIRLIMQQKRGLGSARNLGIKVAYADIIAFLDADDWWNSLMLEKLYTEMNRMDADMVMCDRYNVYYNRDGSYDRKEYLQELAMKDNANSVTENPNLIRNIEVSVNGKLYKKSLFLKYQIWQPDIFGEDRAIIHFLISKCERIAKVREALYYYHCGRKGNSVGTAETYSTTAECMEYIYNLFLLDKTEKKYRYQLNWIFKTIAELGMEGLNYPCRTCDFNKDKAIRKIEIFLDKYGFDRFGKRYIWGSYNLRRMVWLAFPQLKEKRVHFCYSSIISAMSPEIHIDQVPDSGNLDRDNWCKADFRKEFYKNLHILDSDIFLIDFLEERFPVAHYRDSFFTFTPIAKQTLDRNYEYDRIQTVKSEEQSDLWKQNCIEFIKFLKKQVDPEHVVLVKMKLAEQYGDYQKKTYFNNLEKIRKINNILNDYYLFFENNFLGIKIVDCCKGEYFYTDRDFKFGCYPWHLNENFYVYYAEQIEQLFE